MIRDGRPYLLPLMVAGLIGLIAAVFVRQVERDTRLVQLEQRLARVEARLVPRDPTRQRPKIGQP